MYLFDWLGYLVGHSKSRMVTHGIVKPILFILILLIIALQLTLILTSNTPMEYTTVNVTN